MTGHMLDIGIGALEIVLAGYVCRRFWRVRLAFPWLLAPVAFLLLRGVHRIAAGVFGATPRVIEFLLDPLMLAVVVLLLFAVDRIVSGFAAAEEAAVLREREYERALLDYRRLARHRLATPVTVIAGGARFLLQVDPDDTRQRAELVAMIEEAAARLEQVSLDPASELEESERSLRPAPSLAALEHEGGR
jgi:signal transduction histidine kinase